MLDIPVPSPQVVHYETMKKIIELVKKRILVSGLEVPDVERELDLLVANLYGLDQLDQEAMGINQSI